MLLNDQLALCPYNLMKRNAKPTKKPTKKKTTLMCATVFVCAYKSIVYFVSSSVGVEMVASSASSSSSSTSFCQVDFFFSCFFYFLVVSQKLSIALYGFTGYHRMGFTLTILTFNLAACIAHTQSVVRFGCSSPGRHQCIEH